MFGLRAKLPVTDEEKEWIDRSLDRLSSLLGSRRMLQAQVLLPEPEYFPDFYDGSFAAVEQMMRRLCRHMCVDDSHIDLEITPDEDAELKSVVPFWSGSRKDWAGLYFHPTEDGRITIAVKEQQVKEPDALVATLAHELGHVLLLNGGLIDAEAEDMEPLTDLVTVFLGVGVFTANAARRFEQHQGNYVQGWSMNRQGYLSEQIYGYALAKFGEHRGEKDPAWEKYLSTNVRAYCKQSRKWLSAVTPA
jgi:hypothetical protein